MPPKGAATSTAVAAAGGGGARKASTLRSIQETLIKLTEGAAAEWSKDEALDLVYWYRQVIGLALGILWGIIPMPGLIGFFGFLALNLLSTTLLTKNVMGLEDDEWENASQDLMSEGLPYSMSSFMVTWVLSYTIFHA